MRQLWRQELLANAVEDVNYANIDSIGIQIASESIFKDLQVAGAVAWFTAVLHHSLAGCWEGSGAQPTFIKPTMASSWWWLLSSPGSLFDETQEIPEWAAYMQWAPTISVRTWMYSSEHFAYKHTAASSFCTSEFVCMQQSCCDAKKYTVVARYLPLMTLSDRQCLQGPTMTHHPWKWSWSTLDLDRLCPRAHHSKFQLMIQLRLELMWSRPLAWKPPGVFQPPCSGGYQSISHIDWEGVCMLVRSGPEHSFEFICTMYTMSSPACCGKS